MTRRPFVGGNWKCNGDRNSVRELVEHLNNFSAPSTADVCVCPTAIHLDFVSRTLRHPYLVAAQNVSATGNGAYTGEISAEILRDFGIEWTLVGHSERRKLFHESDETLAKKVERALQCGLNVIFCIGETLDERNENRTLDVVFSQLQALIGKVNDWSKLVIAYEPVWAIGTGVNATPQQAQDVHHELRRWLASHAPMNVAENLRIIYGGSVNGKNCAQLASMPDIDGFLVGGASLKADEFGVIINSIASQEAKL